MLQASQTQLVQQTNQAVLAIRQAQLNYFTSFHITFGGQAALIGGFVYSGNLYLPLYIYFILSISLPFKLKSFSMLQSVGLTQIEMQQELGYSHTTLLFLEWVFWVSSTICMASSLHCIFTTILLQVLGNII
jgi:hypothetical protein